MTKRVRWTAAEDTIVRASASIAAAMSQLPGRTFEAVRMRRQTLAVNPGGVIVGPRWSAAEKRVLQQSRSLSEARRSLPGRSSVAIGHYARRLKVKFSEIRHGPYRCWTDEEDRAVRKAASLAEAVRLLPERTTPAIIHRRHRFGMGFPVQCSPASDISGGRPWENEIWRQAHDLVPRYFDPATRDDLISDIVVRILEGEADFRQALKEAMKSHYQAVGRFRTVSLDAPIFSDANTTLLDRLDTEGRIW